MLRIIFKKGGGRVNNFKVINLCVGEYLKVRWKVNYFKVIIYIDGILVREMGY